MPYIKQDRRMELNKNSQLEMIGLKCNSSGELNYVITMICKGYINKYGLIKYDRLSSVKGVLDDIKDEFYRRVMIPYEEMKKNENGDVY